MSYLELMNTIVTVFACTHGKRHLVSLDLSSINMGLGQARELGQRPYVELWATWCTACKAMHARSGEPAMIEAFSGTYVMRVDVDQLGPEAVEAGYASTSIPAIYEVGEDGRATGHMIDARAWADNPEAMVNALRAFFHG